ncbi:MAG: SMC family ATPase [Candidatus Heimdallarchaeota archaeon]|nr:SMC family ATPase [Candidatus Heimdallarchaeota archaeon]MBY8994646.1 SMC family ATPase [Candidatus Heimdallarchaeota archaeon]
MKTFEISDIELENIKTYKYEKVVFSQGNNVLIGENGAGKSTILESIYLSLFGDTVPGRNLVDMIRYGEQQGKITIRFDVDGTNYRIVDELVRKDETRATQSQVLVNETQEETIAEGKNAVKAKMEEILDIDSTTFISAVYASQGEIGKIVTAKDMERKKLFDKLFQIDRYEKAWSNLAKVQKLVDQEIKSLNSHIVILKKDLEELHKIEERIDEKKEQLEIEKKQLVGSKKLYKDVNQQYMQLEKLVGQHTGLIGGRRELEESLEESVEEASKLYKIVKSKITEEIQECSISEIKKQQKKVEKRIEKLNELLEQLRENESNIKVVIEKIRNMEQTLNYQRSTISDKKEELDTEVGEYRTKLPELQADIELWTELLPEILVKKEGNLNNFKKQHIKLDKIKTDVTTQEVELNSLEEASSKYNNRIVKKRLILSNEAGDNWNEIIDEYSKVNFEKDLANLASEISEIEHNHSESLTQKSVLDEGIRRTQSDLQHLKDLDGEETCPTCKQKLSDKTLEKLCESLNEEKGKFQEEKKKLVQEIKEIASTIEELKKKEKNLSKNHQLYVKIEPTYIDLLDLEKEKESVDEDYHKLKSKIEELKTKYSQEEYDELEVKIEGCEILIHEVSLIKKQISKLLRNKQKILEDVKEAETTETEIKELKALFDMKSLEKVQEKMSKYTEEHTQQTGIQDLIRQLVENLQDIEENKKKIEANAVKISEIESTEGFNDWEDIKSQRENLGNDISAKESLITSLNEEVIPPLIKQKNNLLVKKSDLKEKDACLKLENKKREITIILRALMRELPNRLLPNFIERINLAATDILQNIIPGSDIQNIILNADYSLNIIRLGNIEDVTVLSGGETIIIALALRLAFAKEFSALDSLILDEPTIFLDERRRGELVTVLERNRLVRQMFVVTHDPDFERISDKTYFITKEAGETTVKPIDGEEEDDISPLEAGFKLS